MRYHEIYEAAKHLDETGELANTRVDYLHELYLAGINYLDFASIDDHYMVISGLVEHLYHHHHDTIPKKIPSIMLFKGFSKKLLRAHKALNKSKLTLSDLDKQLCMSGLLSIERVKHSASQFNSEDAHDLNFDYYENFVEKFGPLFRTPVSRKTMQLSIARMNRFIIIHRYLVDKYELKYSPRVPRMDDYCKLLASVKKKNSHESLSQYLERFDTANFRNISIYSPWNVCYYKGLRDSLPQLSPSILQKQFTAYITVLKKMDPKKLRPYELEVYEEVKKVLKF
jgi:hypothetical protein